MARNIHHPHDRFMKSLLGDIEFAREYFEAFMPESIKKVVDLSKLTHSPISFISEELKQTQADIVFKCPLIENIQNYTDDQIQQLGSGLFTSALLTQKYADRPELLLERFSQIFSILGSWKGRNLFNTLIVYYIELVEVEEKQLNLLVEQIPKIMKTEFVSLADRLRESGMEQGMEKGMEKKNWIATEKMLRKGYKVSEICDILDVTPEFVENVKKQMNSSGNN